MKGYKVFNPNWTCREFRYEVGKTYEENITPDCYNAGFHFCKKLADCFNYYKFNPDNKQEVLEMVNTGRGDTGLCNSGDRNSGDRNSGDWNSGDRNSGDWNSGNRNSGNCNSGNRNSGDWNSGDRNSGDWNSGDRNSGDRNSGDCNSGDWNKASYSSGVFCTEQPKLIMFNKPAEMTFEQWRRSDACRLLNQIDFKPTEFIWSDDMTDEEKAAHPEWKTTEGYLKKLDTSVCCYDWWMKLSMDEKCIIQNMPNFDAEIFKEITGIQV